MLLQYRFISVLLLTTAVYSPARDALFHTSMNSDWYGGPELKIGRFENQTKVMAGGKAGTIWGNDIHSFQIGGAAYTLSNPVSLSESSDFTFTYGGLTLGYSYRPEMVYHWYSEALLGAGAITVVDDLKKTYGVMVAEVGGGLEVNVTDFLQVGVGAFYRQTTNPDYKNVAAHNLSGLGASLDFTIGYFY